MPDLQKVYNIHPETAGLVTLQNHTPVVKWEKLKQIKTDVGKECGMQYYDKKAVGARMKETRRRRGLTQAELAARLDYSSERQMQRIENGETSCSVDKLMEIAQVLEVTTDYLLFGTMEVQGDRFQRCLANKTEKQTEYLYKLLEAAGENMGLLC